MMKMLTGLSAAVLLTACATQATQETLVPEVAPQWRQTHDALTVSYTHLTLPTTPYV